MTVLPMSAGSAMASGRVAGDGGQLGWIPPDLWAALLDDARSRARVHEKVYRRGPGQCHYWLGRCHRAGTFFKTAREADRLIEGLQAQGVPYVFGVPGAKIVNYRRPRRLRHTTDIAAQLHEDVLL